MERWLWNSLPILALLLSIPIWKDVFFAEVRTDPSEAGKTVVKSIEFFTSPAGAPSVLSVTLNVSQTVAPLPMLVPEPEVQVTFFTNLEDE
jgi:hypothetical protein